MSNRMSQPPDHSEVVRGLGKFLKWILIGKNHTEGPWNQPYTWHVKATVTRTN